MAAVPCKTAETGRVAPAYWEPAAPAYWEPAAPAYWEPASPAYWEPAAPAYWEPAAPGPGNCCQPAHKDLALVSSNDDSFCSVASIY